MYRIYDCDFGFIYDGVTYGFEHVDSLAIEDPELTKLTRGSNAGNKKGIVYKEGVKEPKKVTVTLKGLSVELFNLMSTIYNDQERIESFCIERKTGSSKFFKDAIISQKPQQLTVDETPDAINIGLMLETFNIVEVRKD